MPSSVDDFSVLRVTPFSDAIIKFEELTTQSRRAFLLGAGASHCAGLPLLDELTTTTQASTKLEAKDKAILEGLKANFIGSTNPNIEDYLSELVDLLAIAERRRVRGATQQTVLIDGQEYSEDDLNRAAKRIKLAIVEALSVTPDIDVHRSFVRAVHKTLRPGKWAPDQSVDYLILNYDTLLEDALALERLAYSDGLDGGPTGWWNPATFDRADLMARVLKLHGSINWYQFVGETLPRRTGTKFGAGSPTEEQVLIWPASTKYRETQRDPYAQLAERAREILKPCVGKDRVLLICGYSFGDAHINIELDRALRESENQLALMIFTSDDALSGQLKAWNDDLAVRNQVLIYGRRGFFHGANYALSPTDLPWWKFENVTRLLRGDR